MRSIKTKSERQNIIIKDLDALRLVRVINTVRKELTLHEIRLPDEDSQMLLRLVEGLNTALKTDVGRIRLGNIHRKVYGK